MIVYLLDTNVVSELRRQRPHGAVLSWFDPVADKDLHLSAATIGELQAGIEITRRRDPAGGAALENWLNQVAERFDVLPMDGAAFRCHARLMYGRSDTLSDDAMIAATALVHGLTVVTRNVRDFAPFGVPLLDPFAHNGEN